MNTVKKMVRSALIDSTEKQTNPLVVEPEHLVDGIFGVSLTLLDIKVQLF